VLLELDVNVLKSEIGIAAFGKRTRIANAIAELRRPPSVMSEHTPLLSSPAAAPHTPGTSSPLRSHSQSQSVLTATTQISGPYTPSSAQNQFASSDADNHSPHRRDSDFGVTAESQATLGLGLGLTQSATASSKATVNNIFESGFKGMLMSDQKSRPSQLTLSPSDSALGSTVKAVSDEVPDSADADRAIMSEVRPSSCR
jgi:hypothetical protein